MKVSLTEHAQGWIVSAEEMKVLALIDGETTLERAHYTWTGLTITWEDAAEQKPTKPSVVVRFPQAAGIEALKSPEVAARLATAEAAAAAAEVARLRAAAPGETPSAATERWKTIGLCVTCVSACITGYFASQVPGMRFELETAASLLEEAKCPGPGEGLAVRAGHCASELQALRELETLLRSTIKAYEKRDHDASVIEGQIAGLDEPLVSADDEAARQGGE